MIKFMPFAFLVLVVCFISADACGCGGVGGVGGAGAGVIKQGGSGFIGNKVKNCIGDLTRLTYPEASGCCGDSDGGCGN